MMKSTRNTFQIINEEGLFSIAIKIHLSQLIKSNNTNAIFQAENIIEKLAMATPSADSEQAFELWNKFFLSNK